MPTGTSGLERCIRDHGVEILPQALYWLPQVEKDVPVDLSSHKYDVLCIDDVYIYERFFADFGPLHLGSTVRFCRAVEEKLAKARETSRIVVVKCGHHKHLRTNSALLVGIFCIVSLHKSADEAYLPFVGKSSHFIPYRDAAFGLCTYNLTIIDTLRGVEKSFSNGFFPYAQFNVEEHERLQQIENGDVNWIMPGKLLAFSGPFDDRRQIGPDRFTLSIDDYVPLFKKLNVSCVIRFNKKCYDRRRLTQKGINHVDLFYEDGGNPTDAIMYKFIEVCEKEKGAVAVHCKAGLGRTGTNIGAYMMKHFKYTADEFIGWCRICRPGSVVGPQQQFLADKQSELWKAGDLYKRQTHALRNYQESTNMSVPLSTGRAFANRKEEKRDSYSAHSKTRGASKNSSTSVQFTEIKEIASVNSQYSDESARVSVSRESKASSSSESSSCAENRPMNSRYNTHESRDFNSNSSVRKRTKSTEANKRGQPYHQQVRPKLKSSEKAFLSSRKETSNISNERKKQNSNDTSYRLLREKSKTPTLGRSRGAGRQAPLSVHNKDNSTHARPKTGSSLSRSTNSNTTDAIGRRHQAGTANSSDQRGAAYSYKRQQLGARFVQ